MFRDVRPYPEWLLRCTYLLGVIGLAAFAVSTLLGVIHFSTLPAASVSASEPRSVEEVMVISSTPKLSFSTKQVTPTVTAPGVTTTLTYTIRLLNTGATTATATSLMDVVPTGTTYLSGSLQALTGTAVFTNGVISWTGSVGFDSYVELTFSVELDPAFTGTQIINTAVISDAQIARPVTVSAATILTNVPILTVTKTSSPLKPGPNKPLIYTLTVTNNGQPAVDLPITVTDQVPLSTTVDMVGVDGVTSTTTLTWTRNVTLALGATTEFTFSVRVGDVTPGSAITNATYQVQGVLTETSQGVPYSVTIVAPQLTLAKHQTPDPPGANSEVTYTLTLLNLGSLATNVIITDQVPTNAVYLRGGAYANGVVSWTVAELDTFASTEFTYTVAVTDIAYTPLANTNYRVCSAENVCATGQPISPSIGGPNFKIEVTLDPIAKKPGGGGGPVTPTLIVRNIGPGNAISAVATLYFENISVSANDLYAIPNIGTATPYPTGPVCGGGISNCRSYVWVGSLAMGEAVTFTTSTGQNSIGGAEGNLYTATLVISDTLANAVSPAFTGTAVGHVTHLPNYLVTKSAPAVVGRGEVYTYDLAIYNAGLAGDMPFILTDVVPVSLTVLNVSDAGVTQVISSGAMVSWTLPALNTGELIYRNFSVRVSDAVISGSLLVNEAYRVAWTESGTGTLSVNWGDPVTSTVQDEGLNASIKTVTPAWALPGTGVMLTYVIEVANSSSLSLTNVRLTDDLPWANTTYQRDALTSTGIVVSDIVSLNWTGAVGPLSSQWITLTVKVDPDYEGPVTNTAVITHPSLLAPVNLQAIAYITDEPVLFISKSASPDPVKYGDELEYTLDVLNAGQQATALVITDVLPNRTVYVAASATANGQVVSDTVTWNLSVLETAQDFVFKYRVRVYDVPLIINDRYAVRSAEGSVTVGQPLSTTVQSGYLIYMPMITKP